MNTFDMFLDWVDNSIKRSFDTVEFYIIAGFIFMKWYTWWCVMVYGCMFEMIYGVLLDVILEESIHCHLK